MSAVENAALRLLTACTGTNTIRPVDSPGDVAGATGVLLGADGLPVTSHTEFTGGNLKVLKWSGATRVPFVRGR